MKKKLFLILAIALFTFVPGKVMAATYDIGLDDFNDAMATPGTETEKGIMDDGAGVFVLSNNTYKLIENIDIDTLGYSITIAQADDTNTVLDLNGKKLTALIDYDKGTLTVTGNGTMDNLYSLVLSGTANAIIENGTFDGYVGLNEKSTMTIKDGTFNEVFDVCEQSTLVIENATFANEGNNPMNNFNIFNESQLTIKNGTFDKQIFVSGNTTETAMATINGGTFNKAIQAYYGKITVNGGTFISIEDTDNGIWGNDNIYVNDGGEVIVNGGSFTSPYSGIIAETVDGTNAKSVTINGGTFVGNGTTSFGVALMNVDAISIKKGTFKGNLTAIIVQGTTEDALTGILAEGSSYSPALETQVLYSSFIGTQKEIAVVIDHQDYTIIEGDNQTFDGKDVVIKADGDLEDIKEIQMDTVAVTGEDKLSLTNGSTILTLKKEYLDTLSAGAHKVTFVYNNGSVDATLNIPEKETNNTVTEEVPKTIDNIETYCLVAVLSGLGLAGLYLISKKIKEAH